MFCVPVLNGPSRAGRCCRVAVIRGGGAARAGRLDPVRFSPARPKSRRRRIGVVRSGPSGNAAYKTPRMAMRTDQRASRLDGEANDGGGDEQQPPTPRPPTTSVPAERRRRMQSPNGPTTSEPTATNRSATGSTSAAYEAANQSEFLRAQGEAGAGIVPPRE